MSVQLVAAFVVALGLGAPVPSQESQAPQPIPGGFGRGAYALGPGVTPPVLLDARSPQYPSSAVRAGLEGTVAVEAVVNASGRVGDVRVVRTADGRGALDIAALEAARGHRFDPGRVGGRAVAVIVTLEFTFKLPYRPPSRSAPTPEPFGQGAYLPDGRTVTFPEPIRTVDPEYTAEARLQRIQGEVHVEAIVQPTGTIGDIRVIRSLDTQHGLDQRALDAARRWLFKPGMRDAQRVPVRVVIILTFRL